jgi:hypothetical protein
MATKNKSEVKATPGPWRIFQYTTRNSICIKIVPKGQFGTTEYVASIRKSLKNYRANAALIAAAPEMLEALQVARQRLSLVIPDFNGSKLDLLMLCVISKATGEGR